MDGLNTGYAALLLEQYLDNPAAVPPEWRALFESAPPELLSAQPGLARLLETSRAGNGHVAPAAVEVQEVPVADEELVGGVAAAMSLIKALRM
ncbi:MAG: 2-oxoglutarate dehydrogenase E1 subunit family protein, partial [Gaiellaceae bacterium]